MLLYCFFWTPGSLVAAPAAAFALSWKRLCWKLVTPSLADPCVFAPMALDNLVHLWALQLLLTYSNPVHLVPVVEVREDVKHKHAGDVFSSGTVFSHLGDGQRADAFSPVFFLWKHFKWSVRPVCPSLPAELAAFHGRQEFLSLCSNSLPSVLTPQVSFLLAVQCALSGQEGARVGCQGSSRKQLPSQLPLPHSLWPSPTPHSEPVTLLMLLKTFCFLEEWMPLLFG